MKFYIETFGCKVNTYESSYMEKSLKEGGFLLNNTYKDSDIIIVNTCTVTNTADSKCKKYIRKIKRECPNSLIVAVGCSVQNNFREYKEMGINILLGNIKKSDILSIINNYLQNKTDYSCIFDNRNLPFEDMKINRFNHTRAFIKIQDGCDNFCSYCIIPFVRGKCRSKDFSEIIDEAKSLVKDNHKEIVLTGIHTGSYYNSGKDLVDLINELSKIEGLLRIRLSSVEVTELNDKFIKMLETNNKFCDHLHIPIQSGSDNVLKNMNRKYDIKYFKEKIKEIREVRPNISITTDIIVGFPQEDDNDFRETIDNVSEIKFSKMHVFPYSKRSGTKASFMKEVKDSDKTKRVKELLDLSKKFEKEYEDKFKGHNVSVLIEECKDNVSVGHTSNYLRVTIPKKLNKNDLYEVKFE